MTKEQAFADFLKGLKVTFGISFLYQKEHPSFIKAAKEFLSKIGEASNFLDPIKIGITASSLVIDEITFAGEEMYQDLAKMFHQRRLKSIYIHKGLTLEELIIFLSKSCVPRKEIFKQGGMKYILEGENLSYVFVEELDYSQFLAGKNNEDYADIWAYLLKEAVSENDHKKILEFADNFEVFAKNLNLEELVNNEEFYNHLRKFFEYLKEKDSERFLKCLKEMAKAILRGNNLVAKNNIKKLKIFFDGLSEKDLAFILSEEILNNPNFDYLSFNLFCKLVENRDHEKIASLTVENLKSRKIKDIGKIKTAIEKLFTASENPTISEIYQKALISFLKEIAFGIYAFNKNYVRVDYHFVLLNLLGMETNKEQVKLILGRLSQVWEEILRGSDFGYLKKLVEFINIKRNNSPDFDAIFGPFDILLSAFIENVIWEDKYLSLGMASLIDAARFSSKKADFYLEKIFNENKINFNVLRLFLKFFPDKWVIFCEHLDERYSDMEFMEKIIDACKNVDSYTSMKILKHIYNFPNNLIKIETLNAMGFLSYQDNIFLLSLLRQKELPYRKEALRLLIRDESVRDDVLKEVFLIRSPLGLKNKILLENIAIAEEMCLFEAKDYLELLSKRPFFWNNNVRKKSIEVLGKWNDKKD